MLSQFTAERAAVERLRYGDVVRLFQVVMRQDVNPHGSRYGGVVVYDGKVESVNPPSVRVHASHEVVLDATPTTGPYRADFSTSDRRSRELPTSGGFWRTLGRSGLNDGVRIEALPVAACLEDESPVLSRVAVAVVDGRGPNHNYDDPTLLVRDVAAALAPANVVEQDWIAQQLTPIEPGAPYIG